MTTLAINFPGNVYFNPRTGQSHHPDMAVCALDVDKVICYPPSLDFPDLRVVAQAGATRW